MYKFYSLDNILKTQAMYNIIIGERGNGKTYSALQYGLKQYLIHGHQIGIIRRWEDDFKGRRGQSFFSALIPWIKEFTSNEFNCVRYYSARWYLGHKDDETDEVTWQSEPFAYGFALTTGEHDKSTSYPGIKTIIFDEFLSRTYLPDEFILYMNILSTIIRQRDDVKIFMLANPVSQYSPYYDEMGLTRVREMKPGDMDIYKYGESELVVAVEFTGTSQKQKKGKKSDIYFAFDNPRLDMITGKGGIWELSVHPHAPEKIKPKWVVFSCFFIWDRSYYQGDVVVHDNIMYMYIHRKTGEIKNPDKDIIYTVEYNTKPNYRRNVLKPADKIDGRIRELFNFDMVYYQDNAVGESIASYLEWCKTH